jgi:hypothetical protein
MCASYASFSAGSVYAALLMLPDYSKPYLLGTDASNRAIDAVLSQAGDTDKQTVILRTLTLAEHTMPENECPAIVHALCRRIVAFLAASDNRRVQRWAHLQSVRAMYHLSIEHTSGTVNALAAAISRVGLKLHQPAVQRRRRNIPRKSIPETPLPREQFHLNAAVNRSAGKSKFRTNILYVCVNATLR